MGCDRRRRGPGAGGADRCANGRLAPGALLRAGHWKSHLIATKGHKGHKDREREPAGRIILQVELQLMPGDCAGMRPWRLRLCGTSRTTQTDTGSKANPTV